MRKIFERMLPPLFSFVRSDDCPCGCEDTSFDEDDFVEVGPPAGYRIVTPFDAVIMSDDARAELDREQLDGEDL